MLPENHRDFVREGDTHDVRGEAYNLRSVPRLTPRTLDEVALIVEAVRKEPVEARLACSDRIVTSRGEKCDLRSAPLKALPGDIAARRHN